MPIVSISEAARLASKCRQTLYKHIRQGKLSTSTCVDGSKGIDISELIRVYGVLTVDKTTNVDTNNNRQWTTKATVDTNNSKLVELEKELALSKLRIEQQEKELHYKQTIIDNKQEIIDGKERTINAKQETIDSLKAALKLLEYRQEKTEAIPPKETQTASEPPHPPPTPPIEPATPSTGFWGGFKKLFK